MARGRKRKTEFTRDEVQDEFGAPTISVEVEEVEVAEKEATPKKAEKLVTNFCKQCEAIGTLRSLEGDSSEDARDKRKAARELLNDPHTCGL